MLLPVYKPPPAQTPILPRLTQPTLRHRRSISTDPSDRFNFQQETGAENDKDGGRGRTTKKRSSNGQPKSAVAGGGSGGGGLTTTTDEDVKKYYKYI